MPTLTIDGRSVTVPAGSTILDAARALAIDVPTLCWYPKLPVVGNCRICLVQVEGAPKLVASCATAAADGMRVSTESDDAVKNRQGVLSMLLERYPAEDIPRVGARNEFESLVHRYDVPTTRRVGAAASRGRRARWRSDHSARHVDVHSLHAMCSRVRGHSGRRRARRRAPRRSRADHCRCRRQSGARGMHMVWRMRSRLSDGRHSRHPRARAPDERRLATAMAAITANGRAARLDGNGARDAAPRRRATVSDRHRITTDGNGHARARRVDTAARARSNRAQRLSLLRRRAVRSICR